MLARLRLTSFRFAATVLIAGQCGCMSGALQSQDTAAARIPQSQEMDFAPPLRMKIERSYWATSVNPMDDYAGAYQSTPGMTGGSIKPQDSFLVVELAITNYGNQPLSAIHPPVFVLVGADGTTYQPISQVSGLTEKIVMGGNINPGHASRGRAVFDVPSGSYDLRVELGTVGRGFYISPGGPIARTWILTPTQGQ